MLKVVILNGGRGAGTVIPALVNRQGVHVTSVVNAYDDGKSTGEIRRFFGMLGPSDVRKVQELMLPDDDPCFAENLKVFQYRYPVDCTHDDVLAGLDAFAKGQTPYLGDAFLRDGKIKAALQAFIREFVAALGAVEQVTGTRFNFADCSIMNCIYAGAFLAFDRNIETATLFIDRLFQLRGTVLPTSIEDKKLVALRENGQMLYSEAEIVELRSNVRIERIYLLDQVPERERFDILTLQEKRRYLEWHHCYVAVSPGVRKAVQEADIIIYAAGTQHSSLYPTYLSAGLAESIADNKSAFKVFVTNIGADYETPSYRASDYLLGAYQYLNLSDSRNYSLGELFSVVLLNRSRLKADETYVELDAENFEALPVRRVVDDFESTSKPGRHDGTKVVQTILDLYDEVTTLEVVDAVV